MPLARVPYDPNVGPVIEVEVGHPLALLQRGAHQPSVTATFLVDTGSARSHIANHIASLLSLPPCGVVPIRHRGGIDYVETFPADLTFPQMAYAVRNVELREFKQSALQYGGILGRDVLNLGVVRLDGRMKELQIQF